MQSSIFVARRQALLEQLPPASAVLVASGEELIRNRDVEHPFRASSDFVYLTGFEEPEAILCLFTARQSFAVKTIEENANLPDQGLFLRPKDKVQEIWQGRRLGVEKAAETLKIDQAWSNEDFMMQSQSLFDGVQQIYVSFSELAFWMPKLNDIIQAQKAKSRQGVESAAQICDLDKLLHEARLIKSEAELTIMRQAAQISVQGHLAAMRAALSADFEYQVKAALEAEFHMRGSPRVAFNSIVASGENACILHYTENNAPLNKEALLLVDAGAEFNYYAGDITHTFPVSGRFTSPQAEIYQLVLDAQQAAIAVVKPGVVYHQVHLAAVKVITQGLVDLGLLRGEVERLIEEEAYKRFFMHGTGHWLGMDVHDVGAYKQSGEWRPLQSGMVITVEPGIYIAPESEGVDEIYWGIGVRIEDDVLVTPKGHEVLTRGLPRTLADIEAFMAQENRK